MPQQTATIPVRLSGPAAQPISVRWATRDGTAEAGEDYVAASGTVTWPIGETVRNIAVTITAEADPGVFYIDLTEPSGATISIPVSTITLAASDLPADLTPMVEAMRVAHWAYIQRATGAAAEAAGMPVLVTAEGLVKNNQHTETVLGGYLPDGAASSEGISLMMRGVAQGFAATGDATYRAYFDFLLDAACEYFFFGVRPPSKESGLEWPHTWLVHAGTPFNVRGPIPANGALDQTGHVGAAISFTGGLGQIPGTPPDTVYQVVTGGTQFVWNNVFSDIVAGTGSDVDVEYYIDAAGNKVFGAQKDGSFGQPIEPGSTEPPGRVKLKQPLTGAYLINYCVTVDGDQIAYGEAYEAWPMWRHLMPAEVSIAADAEHWFADAFKVMKDAVPGNIEYARAHGRMLDTWEKTCAIEATDTTMFKAGAAGNYNSWPLTYAFAYGRDDIDDPASNWSAIPPDPRIPVARTPDGYVTFTMPELDPEIGSGEPVRYGFSFEVEPIFLSYTSATKVSLDVRADKAIVGEIDLFDAAGAAFTALVPFPTTPGAAQQIDISGFLRYQDAAGDSDGLDGGDWTGDEPGEPWERPVYSAVPFPGRRTALIGDSITYANSLYNPPISGRYSYQSFGMAGWWNWAMMLADHPLTMEPGATPDVNGTKSGFNFGIAGSQVKDWGLESWEPIATGGLQMGPMFAYRSISSKIDCVIMMGGTNDLSGNREAGAVFLDMLKYAYEIAAAGKWLFWATIPPKTTDLLQGYSLAQQDAIRNRLLQVNQMIRDEFEQRQPPNMFLVDWFDELVGPNGIDPHGCQSDRTNPAGTYTIGNWKPGVPQVVYFPDGLHPGVSGAQRMGEVLHAALISAGVPARAGANLSPFNTTGTNLLANTTFAVSNAMPGGGYSASLGRAIGLGPALTDSTHQRPADIPERNNLGLGYLHGQVPDHWKFYRSSNTDEESFSNFGEYTWSALVGMFPSVQPYMAPPTWQDGQVKTSVVTVGGRRGFKIEAVIPQGNKNEGFVIRGDIPNLQNGPWNAYGYSTWPQTPPPVNTKYSPGDRIFAGAELQLSNIKGLFTLRNSLNFLSLNDAAIGNGDAATTGAVVSGLGMGQNFWPPDLADLERWTPQESTLHIKTPIVTAPAPASGERTYAQFNIEVGLDASQPGGANITLIIFEPEAFKVTGSI